MRRGREREKERRRKQLGMERAAVRGWTTFNNHDTSIHVSPKEGKNLPGTGDNILSWINQSPTEREKVGRGGCTACYKSLCTYKFPPDEIQIDPRRTWADIINCTTRGL